MAVLTGIVDLANEDNILIPLLDLLSGVCPELGRHHLCHVATEAVNALPCPEEQDVGHLLPRIGYGVEVAYAWGIVVDAVVQLHRLVPVVLPRGIVEVVVARSLGRLLQIGFRLAAIQVEVWHEALTGTVVEVVLRVESHHRVVGLAKILHLLGLADGLVLTGHMVGHKVDDDLQPGLVRTLHQLLELLHALLDVDSQVGVYVVVVGDGIGRTCPAFHHGRMLAWNAVLRVVGRRGMADDAGVPHVADAHLGDALQHSGGEVGHLAATVVGYRSLLLARGVTVAVQTRKDLIDDNLLTLIFEH